MSDLTQDQVLNMIVEAQDLIERGYEIINDTGDYEHEDLDKCASLACDLIERLQIAYKYIHKQG